MKKYSKYRRRAKHHCIVNKNIPTLKIELSVKRQNDQEQRLVNKEVL
jgi:hypothetical protein